MTQDCRLEAAGNGGYISASAGCSLRFAFAGTWAVERVCSLVLLPWAARLTGLKARHNGRSKRMVCAWEDFGFQISESKV